MAKQPQHGTLHVRELIAVGVLDRVIRSHELMPADVLENFEDAIGGGCLAGASFGIKRERGDLLPFHAVAKRTLHESFGQQRQEIEEEEGLDPGGALQVDRHDVEHRFELLVALLDTGLVLVGVECLLERQFLIIEDQREDAVAMIVVAERLGFDAPGEIEALSGLSPEGRVLSRPTCGGLGIAMLLADFDSDFNPPLSMGFLEDDGGGAFDLSPCAET